MTSEGESNAALLRFVDVTKIYGEGAGRVEALRGVNLAIRKSEFVVVIDKERARDSRAVEVLGHYNPLASPAAVHFNHERLNH